MGVLERREREKQELRQQILDAAREMFATVGYEATTMRKIAEAIEYSPTSIYLYFRDKEELLREICHNDFVALATAFNQLAQIEDPLERLRQVGMAYIEFGLKYPNQYRFMFMTPLPRCTTPEKQEAIGNPEVDAYAFLKQVVGACIEAGLFRDEFSDVDLVSQILWSGVHGLVSLEITLGQHEEMPWRPVAERANRLLEMQFRGMLRDRAGK
jgi:AcrR family transcriptional regulator